MIMNTLKYFILEVRLKSLIKNKEKFEYKAKMLNDKGIKMYNKMVKYCKNMKVDIETIKGDGENG